jgi:hypothetical protein
MIPTELRQIDILDIALGTFCIWAAAMLLIK